MTPDSTVFFAIRPKKLPIRPFLRHPTEKTVGWHLPVRWIFANFADEGNKPRWLEDGGRDSLGQ